MLSKRYNNDGKAVLKLDSLQVETRHEIESKIAKGIYKFESIPCCICSNKEFESLSNKDRYGMYLPVVICKNCGLIQTNPRMDEESYNSFYKNEYRKLHRGKKPPSEDFFSDQYWRGKIIHRFLNGANLLPVTPDDSVVLEVGCGAGGILQAFREKDFQVQGIDLGEEYLEYAKSKAWFEFTSLLYQRSCIREIPGHYHLFTCFGARSRLKTRVEKHSSFTFS